MILSGLIRITTPAPIDSARGMTVANASAQTAAYIQPGTLSSSLLIAADLKETSSIRGHFTEFPGNDPTVLVQTPFLGNKIPHHTVLHDGPC